MMTAPIRNAGVPLFIALLCAWSAASSAQDGTTLDPSRWTHLTSSGLAAWRVPTGEWHAAGGAAQSDDVAALLTFFPGSLAIVNGPTGRTNNLLTRASHGDVELHVEFMVPEGSNSGVYLQGRYEVQVFDSFGKDDVTYADCGGIYQRWGGDGGYEGAAPRTNASTAPGTWQRFDIEFRAPRFDADGNKTANAKFVRVAHNGTLIHENVEVTGSTRSAVYADEAPLGPLMLQGDHGPVAYRSIRIRPLGASPDTLAGPFKELVTYKFGDPRTPLSAIEREIRESDATAWRGIEARLLGALADPALTEPAAQFVCRMLRRIGTAVSVPVLSDLLYQAGRADMARFALENIPAPEAADALRAALESAGADVLPGIIDSIAARRDAEAVRQLAIVSSSVSLDHPERFEAARRAIVALGEIGTDEALRLLVPESGTLENLVDVKDLREARWARQSPLGRELDTLRSEAAVAAAGHLVSQPEHVDHARRVLTKVKDLAYDAQVRAAAARALALNAPAGQGPPIVSALLKDESPVLRDMGIKLAAEIQDQTTSMVLAWELEGLPEAMQVKLLAALRARGEKQPEAIIRQLIETTPSGAVRLAAIRSLERIGGPDSVPLLVAHAGQRGEIGEAAAFSLKHLGGEGFVDGVLIARVREGSVASRMAAIEAIAARRVHGAIPVLLSMQDTPDLELRTALYDAVGVLGAEPEIPELVLALESAENPRVRSAVENALSALVRRADSPSLITTLLLQRLAQSPGEASRVSLVKVLGSLSYETAINPLLVEYQRGSDDLKLAVLGVFSAWNSPDPAAILRNIAATEQDRTRRIVALRGFIALVRLPSDRGASETALMLSDAIRLADRVEERQSALAAIADYPSSTALRIVAQFEDDEALKEVAARTAATIAEALQP